MGFLVVGGEKSRRSLLLLRLEIVGMGMSIDGWELWCLFLLCYVAGYGFYVV